MKHEFFIDQPSVDIHRGIQVMGDTALEYKSRRVVQVLRDLTLTTDLSDEGVSGANSYSSKSRITINLNEGDILLFDPDRGYYMSPYPQTTVEQALSDISALREIVPIPEEPSEVE